jgi:peptidoglycan/LPS O-acetylase OafA/YrhL
MVKVSGFDGFRAMSFLAVFVFHAYGGFGYLGVQAFFVLSGFLITEILVESKASEPAGAYFANFYGRRSLRIFPLYYLYLAAVAVACAYLSGTSAYEEVAKRSTELFPWAISYALNFKFALLGPHESPFLGHLWTLAVEEQFYLVWPLVIVLVPARHLQAALLSLVVLGPLLRGVELLLSEPYAHAPAPDIFVYALPLSHVDAFATGGYAALFMRPSNRLGRWILPMSVATILVGMATAQLNTGSYHLSSFGYPSFMRDSGKPVWGYTLVNVVSALVVVQLRGGLFLPWLFEHRTLVRLGRMSYGLYVYHLAVIWAVQQATTGWSVFVQVMLALSASIAVSHLSFRYVERPLTALKDRYFAKASAAGEPHPLERPSPPNPSLRVQSGP